MLGQFPHGKRFLKRQIPMVRGSEMDFNLNNHGELSVFEVPLEGVRGRGDKQIYNIIYLWDLRWPNLCQRYKGTAPYNLYIKSSPADEHK